MKGTELVATDTEPELVDAEPVDSDPAITLLHERITYIEGAIADTKSKVNANREISLMTLGISILVLYYITREAT